MKVKNGKKLGNQKKGSYLRLFPLYDGIDAYSFVATSFILLCRLSCSDANPIYSIDAQKYMFRVKHFILITLR